MASYSARITNLSSAKRALLDARLEGNGVKRAPIAVIGLGCRLPGADSPDYFWQLLKGGVDAIREVPSDRWNIDAFYDPNPEKPGKMSTRWGGFLSGVDGFDPHFFGISPREAARMDPQQRVLLEVTWEALEDAGQVVDRLAGTSTGVFVGIATNDYGSIQMSHPSQIDGHTGTGGAMSIAANRISYLFDFQGPSLAVDTACSSSLVAVHLACQSLWSGESTLAIAGGVNVILAPGIAINFSKAGAMAPDGRCKTFDSRANGYVRGEGAGVVVLKPLAAALAGGDPIYAIVRGSAVNQDGRTNGLMAPNRFSQEALLRQAYACAGISPGDIQYVEAHGTGTLLGDPIEVGALGAVLAEGRTRDRACVLGAVKSNIGHLEAAAGIAGLIKTVLALRHRQIPPNLHFLEPNPHIPFDMLPLRVAQTLEPWPLHEGTALAGVSSFGFGGTNAHVVLEEPPPCAGGLLRAEPKELADAQVLPISARSAEALRDLVVRYRDLLAVESDATVKDICYASGVRRSHHEHRLALIAHSKDEAVECIESFLGQEPCGSVYAGVKSSGQKPKLVFVFSGQGSQWQGMGRQLSESYPVFRNSIERSSATIREFAGWDLLEALRSETPIAGIDVIQPALFAIEAALGDLWRSWGIEPDAVVGHSLGEIAAAYFAGALNLRDAVQIVCSRSRLMRRLAGQGAMAVINLPLGDVEKLLRGYEERLSLAAHNSPTSTVISGNPAALAEVVNSLPSEGVFRGIVQVDVAAHSPQLEVLRREMLEALEGMQSSHVKIPFYSTVQSGRVNNFDPQYWWQNMRDMVRFSAAVEALIAAGHDLFVEISSHPILGNAISDSLRVNGKEGSVLSSLRRGANETAALLSSVAALYAAGWSVEWARLYLEPGRHVRLPSYPWQRERCWLETNGPSEPRGSVPATRTEETGRPLLGRKLNLAGLRTDERWESGLSKEAAPPFVLDHQVQGAVILPGAAYVEMALAAALEISGPGHVVLSNVQFHRALFLSDGDARRVQTVVSAASMGERKFQVYSRPCTGGAIDEPWVLHAEGTISAARDDPPSSPSERIEEIRAHLAEKLEGPDFYAATRALGNEYGPCHQGLEHIWKCKERTLAEIRAPAPVEREMGDYQIHPALLDAAWQALGAVLVQSTDGERRYGPTVPVAIDHIKVLGRPGPHSWSYARLRKSEKAGEHVGDINLLDEDGKVLVETCGLRLRALDVAAEHVSRTDSDQWLYEMKWRLSPRSSVRGFTTSVSEPATWLILADSAGVAEQLTTLLAGRGDTPVLVHPAARFERLDRLRYTVRRGNSEDLARMLDSVSEEGLPRSRGVLHLWALDLVFEAHTSSMLEQTLQGCGSAVCLIQTLAHAREAVPLWIVTRGAQPVHGPECLALAQSPLWGLGRVMAQEHPSLWGGLIDLDPAARPEHNAAALLLDVTDREKEDQIAYRRGARFVPRLERTARSSTRRDLRWLPDATYLITGGLGELGLEVARWMVGQGARQVVLLSRTKLPSREHWRAAEKNTRLARQIETIKELEAEGTAVITASVDVADERQLSSFLEQYREAGRAPIRGVVHAAGIVEMKPLVELDPAALEAILRPKIAGAWLLHRLLQNDKLDFFVMFSSVASLLSSPLLGAYASANAFLDALAHHRRAEGSAALSINWAAWAGVGMAARYLRSGHALARGVETFTLEQGMAVIERLLKEDVVETGVMRVDWGAWSRLYPALGNSPVVSELLRAEASGATGAHKRIGNPVREMLLAAEPVNRQRILEEYLHGQAARVLGLPTSRLDSQRPLTTLGLDSLMTLELRNRVEADLKLTVPLVEFLQGPSVSELSCKLLEQLLASSMFSSARERACVQISEGDWETLTL